MIDYSSLDRSPALQYVFYPRRDVTPCPENAFDLSIRVEERLSVSSRFYIGHRDWPWILFFHGNGEEISDYDDIAPFYRSRKINLAVADYRGYGASGGHPTLTDLVRDSHTIFREARRELAARKFQEDLWVMGRSLGSVSALELAHQHGEEIKGLIIESGFPSVARIITHLRIPAPGVDLEAIDRGCLEMIREIRSPALIIHGDQDTLVPIRNAQEIQEHLGSREKKLLVIPSATHNDILLVGFKEYFDALDRLIHKG